MNISHSNICKVLLKNANWLCDERLSFKHQEISTKSWIPLEICILYFKFDQILIKCVFHRGIAVSPLKGARGAIAPLYFEEDLNCTH